MTHADPVSDGLQHRITRSLIAALEVTRMKYGTVGSRDVDVADWNARIDSAIKALTSTLEQSAARSVARVEQCPECEAYDADAVCPQCKVFPAKDWCTSCGCGSDRAGYAHLPLCPRGATPAEPITEAQAVARWHENKEAHKRSCAFEWFVSGILAAERHHGIRTPPSEQRKGAERA
jgi:hypothetical protein